MPLNDKELLYVYHGLHHIFREDVHLARPLIQILQRQNETEKALQLAMEMARRMLARGQASSALGFLEICKRLNYPQQDDLESMISMAKMTLGTAQPTSNKTFSLIDKLSDKEAMDFILQSRIFRCNDGDTVVQQGEISDSFYLILEGQMKVHLQLGAGSDIHLSTLLPGYYFGEYACVYKLPRTANVTAVGEAVILEFSNEAITQLMEQSPAAGEQLMKAVKTRLIRSMTQTHPAFTQLAEADRDWLAEESNIIEIEEGILAGHDMTDQCCVVIHGKLAAKREVKNQLLQCSLGKDDMFGDLNKHLMLPSSTTLSAESRCLICCIPGPIFQSFMTAYGDFEHWVETHGDSRCQGLSSHSGLFRVS